MPEHESNPHQKKQQTIPLEDIVAPLICVIGIAASIVAVHRFTGLTFWATALLGVAGFFIIVSGGLWLLSRRR